MLAELSGPIPMADAADGKRRKKFSLKRWVKKLVAKRRRALEETQLKRKQRKDLKKKAKSSDDRSMDGLVERFNQLPISIPSKCDNNQDDDSAIEPTIAPSRKESVALRIGVPYTEAITIKNPIFEGLDDEPNQSQRKTPLLRAEAPEDTSRGGNVRFDLFSQINKLPENPMDFLREPKKNRALKPRLIHALTKPQPQFTGPIAQVLAQAALALDGDDSSDEDSSDDEWQ
ncbi:unnamed protein product [Aphanomyces euteiches]|uniref:Uncharacterized protein n=1 Tax=Aphanomyces euteiches TaxID=100861 RepID=A0A6G0X1W9_9STRA|nr:hypothetical protein Ae201684_009336 [Aphanomyces euteiches]KAH9141896.1 hypothetical protein AeRB84_013969 [Aphanomyces euteiches]